MNSAAQPQPYGKGSPFEVQDTPEFRRVLNLRRRDWEEEIQHNDLHLRMTTAFKLPQGQQSLRLIQAAALADAHDMRGLLAPIRVGEGKTHVSFLLPTVIPGVQRPLLLLPASLIEKTWREFRELQRHWVSHPRLITRKGFDQSVLSYEKLGRDSGKDLLKTLRPDMIVADEVHKLRERQAARTRRVERFMIANPETIFCGLSGTITKRSIRDYWHLIYWALRHGMPLPRTEAEMEKWAEVLDEKKADAMGRRAPGVLMSFCNEEEIAAATPQRTAPLGRTQQMPIFHFKQRLQSARKGYQRRLRETPGVICSPDRNLDCSLIIRRRVVHPSPVMEKHFARLRGEGTPDGAWITPNGEVLEQPVQVWAMARQLACGFYYKWDPPPPPEWLARRSAWSWYVRNILMWDGELYEEYKHLHLDSPMQVALAVKGSTYTDDHGNEIVRPPTITDPVIQQTLRNWDEIKNTFKINVVAEWLDNTMLEFCLGWMRENRSGIVWTEHRAFGQKLAAMLGTGFCSTGGLDENGKPIEDYKGAPVVASVQANCEGRNLQAWNRNLIVTMSPTGYIGEQLLGRTHRMGQEADTVYVDWVAGCEEQDKGFDQMIADARYIQDTTGQSQKLLYADRIY